MVQHWQAFVLYHSLKPVPSALSAAKNGGIPHPTDENTDSEFATFPDQPKEEVTLEQSLRTQVIAGAVDDVVDQILAMRELIGPFGTIVYTGADWADEVLGRRSMELMAEKVMPRLNDALKADEAEITARLASELMAE